ncbi:hypothetical protein B0H19DRAFT_1064664 [Mycena capillaripes]|nr:hypothetical protein B0H19DRAFT_1064664 [Mycena capillaripes]
MTSSAITFSSAVALRHQPPASFNQASGGLQHSEHIPPSPATPTNDIKIMGCQIAAPDVKDAFSAKVPHLCQIDYLSLQRDFFFLLKDHAKDLFQDTSGQIIYSMNTNTAVTLYFKDPSLSCKPILDYTRSRQPTHRQGKNREAAILQLRRGSKRPYRLHITRVAREWKCERETDKHRQTRGMVMSKPCHIMQMDSSENERTTSVPETKQPL